MKTKLFMIISLLLAITCFTAESNEIHTLTISRSHTAEVRSVAFSPDGTIIASGGDYIIRLWNVSDGSHIHTLSGFTWNIRSVAFSPDGNTIANGECKREH